MSTTIRTWMAVVTLVAVWAVIAGWSLSILGGLAPRGPAKLADSELPVIEAAAPTVVVFENTTAQPHAN